nr:hypothetical protein [Bacteroidales bacterium]
MKFIIFFAIFLIVFGFAGYYVYVRAMQTFTGSFVNSKLVMLLYIFLMLSFLSGKVIEIYSISIFSELLVKIGSIVISLFLYSLIFVILLDFIRLLNYIIPFYPNFLTLSFHKLKFIIGIIALIFISAIFIIGYFNAQNPKVKNLNITINKSKAGFDTSNIVAVSDIHLGTAVNKIKTKKLIKAINAQNPDLIIFGGDII